MIFDSSLNYDKVVFQVGSKVFAMCVAVLLEERPRSSPHRSKEVKIYKKLVKFYCSFVFLPSKHAPSKFTVSVMGLRDKSVNNN